MRRSITWCVRGKHPWVVIAAWIVVAGVLSLGPTLQSVTTNDASKGLSDKVESKRADALQQAEFADAEGTPLIVVYSSEAPLTAAQKAAVEDGKSWLLGGAEPVNSASVQFSEDGRGALVLASLDGNPGEEEFRASVQAIRDHYGDTVEGMDVRVTGPGGLITDVFKIFLNADIKLLVGTVILVLVLLLVIYRSPVLPFVPLVAVGFGYFVAGGLLALLANAFDVTLSGQATSLMVILLFGAGTDYGLLLISRYRRGAGRAHRHVPRAHGAGAGAHALGGIEGRLAGAALDEERRGRAGPAAGLPRVGRARGGRGLNVAPRRREQRCRLASPAAGATARRPASRSRPAGAGRSSTAAGPTACW